MLQATEREKVIVGRVVVALLVVVSLCWLPIIQGISAHYYQHHHHRASYGFCMSLREWTSFQNLASICGPQSWLQKLILLSGVLAIVLIVLSMIFSSLVLHVGSLLDNSFSHNAGYNLSSKTYFYSGTAHYWPKEYLSCHILMNFPPCFPSPQNKFIYNSIIAHAALNTPVFKTWTKLGIRFFSACSNNWTKWPAIRGVNQTKPLFGHWLLSTSYFKPWIM